MRIGNVIFGGERPKVDPRNLETFEAQIALDCDLVSSTLRAILAPSVELDGISENTQTIHFFENTWFAFDEQLDIIEQSGMLMWTGPSGARQATFAQLQSGQSNALGVPKPDAPVVALTGTGDPASIPFTTFYATSFVNQDNREGDISDPSVSFVAQEGQTVTVTNIAGVDQTDPAAVLDAGIVAIRVYRLDENEARFVAEIPITQTTFTEVLGSITLAEVFPSEDFAPPPPGLTGLHLMSNGIALGFVPGERLVYVSEPFNANAWPFFFPVQDVPIGISSYDNNAVIVTDGYPEVAAINDPRNIVPTTLTYREPCQSKLSLVQAEGGVIYASVNSLFYIGRGGGRRITQEHIDHDSWQPYAPSTIIGLYRDQQYIGFHQGSKEGNALVFDMRAREDLRQLSQSATAVFIQPGTDQGFVAFGGQILQLEGSEDRLVYRYKSKVHGEGSPFALTSRRVLSCEHIDRSYSPDAGDTSEEIVAARAAAIAARSTLGVAFGLGGAINQHLIGGCFNPVPDGIDNPFPEALRSINGIAAEDLARSEPIEVIFRLFGDKELVHEETIVDDEQENRLYYFDRRRVYETELEGTLEISQLDVAGSNSEFHSGT